MMDKEEFKKFEQTPEGGCLVIACMWAFVIVFAIFCSWLFSSLY